MLLMYRGVESYYLKGIEIDGVFFYRYEPELIETSESICRACMTCNLHRNDGFEIFESIRRACTTCNLDRKGGPAGDVSAASPIVKSVSFEEKKKDIIMLGFLLSLFFPILPKWSFSLFFMGDPDNLPC